MKKKIYLILYVLIFTAFLLNLVNCGENESGESGSEIENKKEPVREVIKDRDTTLIMGYRTNKREPLIGKSPDNSGLYLELYKRAAKILGFKLVIVRYPKKRILKGLKKGEIDFYPGFNFTEERSQFIFYIENGLPGGDVCISRKEFPEITDLKQLKGKNLLLAKGGPDFLKGITGVKLHEVSELTLTRVADIIRSRKGFVYIYNRSTIEYFIKKNKIKYLKIHFNCYGGYKPLYLGFSKKSLHFKSKQNPKYNPSKPLSIDNYPLILDKSSIVYQFSVALRKMARKGITKKLYNQFYQ